MTTFKNNAKYAELLFTYLDVAIRGDTPLKVPDVLSVFQWRFKGGSLRSAASESLYPLDTSATEYPEGLSVDIAREWPDGRQARALREILINRMKDGRLRARAVLARLGTYKMLTSKLGALDRPPLVYSGMKAIYYVFGKVWEWSARVSISQSWETLRNFTQELLVGCSSVSRVHLPTVDLCRKAYQDMVDRSRVPQLLEAIRQVKNLIFRVGGPDARRMARTMGRMERDRWGENTHPDAMLNRVLWDDQAETMALRHTVGPVMFRYSQGIAVSGAGLCRFAMGMSDMERLHQVLMSTASCLAGVAAQASVGTFKQRVAARRGMQVAEQNISRIVNSARLVPLGDEVLVCKGYRRAYTALLGLMSGPLCRVEAEELVNEARDTAGKGVLDIDGFLWDSRGLDDATALNVAKVFKICPAPDVSPGGAMIDRIKTIGQGNRVDADMMPLFKAELRTQILRAYIRRPGPRLKFRNNANRPSWAFDYLEGKFEKVPSVEIHDNLIWEGTATMPEISPYDTSNWKDSGLGADTLREGEMHGGLGHKSNMLTRLLFDDNVPLPGRCMVSHEHVIKFFVKAEGHKDPARGIFSANLTDRFAQSWMEKGVDTVARHHPSYMIGQAIEDREAKVRQLTARPTEGGILAFFYSFDISGWSAKMPAETQRISHGIWAELYGGHLFTQASQINEGATIYLDIEGYRGWFRNTHANLEGFNGKEMTMVLVALLSLSVRRWREVVIAKEVLTVVEAQTTSALLFAYIDDGLSRIDLPKRKAAVAFDLYKKTVIETFAMCGFTVEVSKCFPSDRFAIFLNEVYVAGRHVVHGVRAAMGISAEPTERHTSLVERVTTVATGIRGAVMAGLNPTSACMLMAYHLYMHLEEWVTERDPVLLAGWCMCPRAWGGLGIPSMMQIYVSGSGSAFEESVATMQAFARLNDAVKKAFLLLCRESISERDAVGVLTAPLSGKVTTGYMVDSRVGVAVRKALKEKADGGKLSSYARRLIRYSDSQAFKRYADAVVPLGTAESIQEQMLVNLAEAHPHSVFSAFARRLEKSVTVRTVIGRSALIDMIRANRLEAGYSVSAFRDRTR